MIIDIGKLKNNSVFYDGFDGEREVTLTLVDKPQCNIHIWDGYFYDIFGNPPLDGKGWHGFTRDYNEMIRTFGDDDYIITNITEYLEDMLIYSENKYDEETAACYTLLRDFLKYAIENNSQILIHVL